MYPLPLRRSTAATNGATKSRSASSGVAPILPTLEELEPVLHTGEGPLAFRDTGICFCKAGYNLTLTLV
jgi:hypothetical protein